MVIADEVFVVTKSDTVNDPGNENHEGFFIMTSTDGDVKVTTSRGQEVVVAGMKAGIIYPFRVRRVWSTGTTATGQITGFRD